MLVASVPATCCALDLNTGAANLDCYRTCYREQDSGNSEAHFEFEKGAGTGVLLRTGDYAEPSKTMSKAVCHQLDRADPGIQRPLTITVAIAAPFWCAFVAFSTQLHGHLQLHQLLSQHAPTFAKKL